jgi:hypothetical protein
MPICNEMYEYHGRIVTEHCLSPEIPPVFVGSSIIQVSMAYLCSVTRSHFCRTASSTPLFLDAAFNR